MWTVEGWSLEYMIFVEIVKTVLNLWFHSISPDFIHFRVFKAILNVKHILTFKIIQFYESTRNFNNFILIY